MTMHKALHLRDGIHRLYVSYRGGRELSTIEDCVDLILEDYFLKEQRKCTYSSQ